MNNIQHKILCSDLLTQSSLYRFFCEKYYVDYLIANNQPTADVFNKIKEVKNNFYSLGLRSIDTAKNINEYFYDV